MARRTIGLVVALATVAAVAGCGGGTDDPGFAEATDRTCREVTTAVATLQQDLVRGTGADEGAALKAVIDRYTGTVTTAADRLAKTAAPKADREFQRQAVSRLRKHATDLRAAAAASRSGGMTEAEATRLAAAGTLAMPLIPPAVLDKAPSCQVAAR